MFFCMSKIIKDNKTFVIHGKGLKKNIAESASKIDYQGIDYQIISWVDRVDKPHICNVESCPLFRMYLTDKFWKIGIRVLMYNECKKILKRHLPNDIVLFILKKCFRK